jgi:hypothetical protein
MATAITEAAGQCLGPKPRARADSIPPSTQSDIRTAKAEVQRLFEAARQAPDPQRSKDLLRQSHIAGKEHRRLTRKAVHAQWNGIIARLEEADLKQDMVYFLSGNAEP